MSVLAGHRLVAVDLETTGWERTADVIEVAAVTLVDAAIDEEWASFVNPRRSIPFDAIRVHGISDVMVAGAPTAEAIGGRLAASCAGATLVLHNASFDLPFLQRMVVGSGRPPLWYPIVDTLGLARGRSGSGGNRLEELAPRHGVELDRAHRALPDARATAGMLRALAPLWERERAVRSLAELAAASWDALRLSGRWPAAPRLP